MFKVGDKVRRVQPSHWPKDHGYVGEVYTVSRATKTSIDLKEGFYLCKSDAFALVERVSSVVETTTKKRLKRGWHGPLWIGDESHDQVYIEVHKDMQVDELTTLIKQLTEVRDYLEEKDDV